MEITKENIDKAIIDILTDPKKIQELVDNISGAIVDTIIKDKEELKYNVYYFLDSDLNVEDYSNCIIKNNIDKYCKYYSFDFTSRESAELWAKKLKALNKLRMIKELIDIEDLTDPLYYFIVKDGNCYYPTTLEKGALKEISPFTIAFNSRAITNKAIEFMGKESLDNLFLEIN